MNKLNKTITRKWFKDPASFLNLKEFWSSEMQLRRKLKCEYHLLYKILIGKDWRTGVQNDIKIRELVKSHYRLGGHLSFFKDHIDITIASNLIPELIGNYEAAYKDEVCQKHMSMQS